MFNLSEEYSAVVGSEHRRAHGQFFTPFEVAVFMCRWVLSGMSRDLYDPAFGLGSFYRAAKSVLPSVAVTATEIDAEILEYFRRHAPESTSLSLRCEDYLGAWGQTHGAIVCNPPYMRFQHFTKRNEVFASFAKHLHARLSGYTNIASAFLLKSLSELTHGGRLAYIMPLEFLNTGYGAMVKERLLGQGMLKALIRLEAEKEIFPDATTSVGIILASNDQKVEPVRFYTVRNLESLRDVLTNEPTRAIPVEKLDPSEKWQKYFDNRQSSFSSPHLVPIGLYGGFSRGIATGANEFFALPLSKAVQLGIPRSHFLSCITKSAQVKSPVFTSSDYDELERSDANVFLLNVSGEPTEVIREYLRYGEKNGYHLRYLTKMRTPWYKLERRTPAPLLFGVFSRGKFKVVRNLSAAVNLTCFHCFYPNLFGQPYCDALFLYFQSKAARQVLGISMRRYGDGLEKFEPNDLNRALAPSPGWLSRLSPDVVQNAVDYCGVKNSLPPEMESAFDSLKNCAEQDAGPYSVHAAAQR